MVCDVECSNSKGSFSVKTYIYFALGYVRDLAIKRWIVVLDFWYCLFVSISVFGSGSKYSTTEWFAFTSALRPRSHLHSNLYEKITSMASVLVYKSLVTHSHEHGHINRPCLSPFVDMSHHIFEVTFSFQIPHNGRQVLRYTEAWESFDEFRQLL